MKIETVSQLEEICKEREIKMPSTPYLQESMMKIINEKGSIETT